MDAGVPDSIAALEEDRVCSVMIDAETLEEVGEKMEVSTAPSSQFALDLEHRRFRRGLTIS